MNHCTGERKNESHRRIPSFSRDTGGRSQSNLLGFECTDTDYFPKYDWTGIDHLNGFRVRMYGYECTYFSGYVRNFYFGFYLLQKKLSTGTSQLEEEYLIYHWNALFPELEYGCTFFPGYGWSTTLKTVNSSSSSPSSMASLGLLKETQGNVQR